MIFRRIEFRLKYRRFGIHTVGYAIKKSIVTQIFDVRHAIYRIIPHAPDMMDRKTSISNAINAIVCDKHRLTMPNGKFLYFSFIHFFCDFFFYRLFFCTFFRGVDNIQFNQMLSQVVERMLLDNKVRIFLLVLSCTMSLLQSLSF